MAVRIVELSDRYLVVDAETGESVDEFDPESGGFSDEESARNWAVRNDFEIDE